MSLVEFMQQLQDQDNLVFSEAPEPSIKVIPPEKPVYTKVIPPEGISSKPPTKIKLNINKKTVEVANKQIQSLNNNVDNKHQILKSPPKQNDSNIVKQQPKQQDVQNNINQQQIVNNSQQVTNNTISNNQTNINNNTTTKQQNQQLSDETLFIYTGTEISKKSIWLEYYHKAKSSRKSNPIVARMKQGRFTITPDNKVLLLPDYDIVGKDPDDVLKDKWF